MDQLLNNEALIACIVAKAMENRTCNIPLITLLVPIMLDDNVRKKISRNQTPTNKELQRVGMSYKDLLVPTMNSIILLKEGQCLYIDNGMLKPTPTSLGLYSSINNKSSRLAQILPDIDPVMDFLTASDIVTTFQNLHISL